MTARLIHVVVKSLACLARREQPARLHAAEIRIASREVVLSGNWRLEAHATVPRTIQLRAILFIILEVAVSLVHAIDESRLRVAIRQLSRLEIGRLDISPSSTVLGYQWFSIWRSVHGVPDLL